MRSSARLATSFLTPPLPMPTVSTDTMTTEQRILTALRCEQPDRVPVLLFLNPYSDAWYVHDPPYADVLKVCEEYEDIIYDWGFPSGFFCTAAELETYTRELGNGLTEQVRVTPAGEISTIGKPDWRGWGTVKRWVTTPADAERLLSVPYVPPRPDLAVIKETRARLSPRCVAQATFMDPTCIAGLIDEQAIAIWTLEERDLLRQLLDTCQERLLDQLRYCLDNGLGPIFYFNGPEYALPPLMSPDDFDEFVVPYDTELIELVHSYPDRCVIVHSHGRVNDFLERFAAMGTDGLNVLEPPPIGDTVLADAKRRIGDQVCLIGNIQYDDLARGSKDHIERLVAEAIEQGASGGGFILCPCASPYERPLPPKASENFIHYLRMARKHG